MELLVWLLIWIVCGMAAGALMSKKGRSWNAGFVLGFLLGPIGVVIALVFRANTSKTGEFKVCSQCAERIRTEAKICRYCGSDVSALDIEGGVLYGKESMDLEQ